MKKKCTRTILWCIAVFSIIYILSYMGISVNGRYEPAAFGLLQGHDGHAILAPKAVFGYQWHPFEQYSNDGSPRLMTVFYLPLISIDRKVWHTDDKMKTKRYRIKDYFDYRTMTYSDIEPR